MGDFGGVRGGVAIALGVGGNGVLLASVNSTESLLIDVRCVEDGLLRAGRVGLR